MGGEIGSHAWREGDKGERDTEGERQRRGNMGVRTGKGGLNSLVQEKRISRRALPFHLISVDARTWDTHGYTLTTTHTENQQHKEDKRLTLQRKHHACLRVDTVLQHKVNQSITLQIQQQQRHKHRGQDLVITHRHTNKRM